MKIKLKYFGKVYEDEKVPRKIKKAILGTIVNKNKLRKRIAKTKIETYNPYSNGYTFNYPNDEFCPYCGCELITSTGNMAEYPEEYIIDYCLRCGKKFRLVITEVYGM